MPVRVGASQLLRMRDNANRMMQKAASVRGKAEGTVESVVRTMEVAGSAFAAGMVNGRYGGVEIVGVPADLAGGLAAHALAFVGVAGRNGKHLHALADGLLASDACTLGRGTGVNMREKALATKPQVAVRGASRPSIAGSAEAVAGERLSEAELRELAHT